MIASFLYVITIEYFCRYNYTMMQLLFHKIFSTLQHFCHSILVISILSIRRRQQVNKYSPLHQAIFVTRDKQNPTSYWINIFISYQANCLIFPEFQSLDNFGTKYPQKNYVHFRREKSLMCRVQNCYFL